MRSNGLCFSVRLVTKVLKMAYGPPPVIKVLVDVTRSVGQKARKQPTFDPHDTPQYLGLVRRFDVVQFESRVVYIWLIDICLSRNSSASIDAYPVVWTSVMREIGNENVGDVRDGTSSCGAVISSADRPQTIRVTDVNLTFTVLETERSSWENRNWILLETYLDEYGHPASA